MGITCNTNEINIDVSVQASFTKPNIIKKPGNSTAHLATTECALGEVKRGRGEEKLPNQLVQDTSFIRLIRRQTMLQTRRQRRARP